MKLAQRIHARLPSRVRSTPLVSVPAGRLREREVERETSRLVELVRPFSMVAEPTLRDLELRVNEILDAGVPGDFVECGVWRGGSAFLMAEVLKRRGEDSRKVWLFDSFEGLPPPQAIDGPAAAAYAEDRESPRYFDNCRAAVEEVRSNARALELEGLTRIVPGWFDDTLPATVDEIGPIALLRLDCDWYESVLLCLETLYDHVSPGGLTILDDYYQWDGCAIAAHEFLARRALPHRLHESARVALLRKPAA